ncbi:uncharacterized protein BHQ10_003055 [Talaromyces amestolkiae]|uniref:Methyltransferase type 11 domain-containing protein n=1 Tax=Talaromyces amestolkiae TaxID=1196081 RepID=A0A364KU27_TALAM|nr:uncharacterized protein BHQ10_003055 [Talaromyces amestolkiae]RAO67043.1 hypothetical protein BHQ10_003055 [Talaromyces amestolkiae]
MAVLDFNQIYNDNTWGSSESRSGRGSELAQTQHIRGALPSLLAELGVSSLLDVPCGDFHWMQHVDLGAIKYIGGDIVEDIITENQRTFKSRKNVSFKTIDILKDELPKADAVLCRDLFVHFTLDDALRGIANVCRSGATYLIATTFTDRLTNSETLLLDMWRPLNMVQPPFNFPSPVAVINEQCTDMDFGLDYSDKCLGVWRICDIKNVSV